MENSKSLKENKERKTGQIIRIEQEQLTRHLDKVVRGTIEETLNALLDAEADQLCQASRYERTEKRQDTRAGHYKRKLGTKAGQVELQVPKLRTLSFERLSKDTVAEKVWWKKRSSRCIWRVYP